MKRALSFNAILVGIVLGVAFWLFDCVADAALFKEGSIAQQLLSPSAAEIWVRSFVMALFVGFSVYSHGIIAKLRGARETLISANKKLADLSEERGASLVRESSERMRVEEALASVAKYAEDERARADAIIEGLGVGVIIQDLDYRVVYENDLQQRTVGTHVGQFCFKAYAGREDLCPDCPMVLSLADGGIHSAEKEAPSAEGVKHYEITTSPLRDSHGNIIGGVKVVKDITRLKELEERMLHSHRMETIGALSAGISHEYNNIISIIKGAAELMEEEVKDGSPLRRYLDVIRDSTVRAAALTHGLLTYSRKHAYSPAPVNLNDVIVRVEGMLRRIIGSSAELKLELTAEEPIVMADASHLEQALINLVTNARDAMPESGTITVKTALVEMDGEFVAAKNFGEPGRYVLLSVADTGTGIDEHTRRKLFEPFFTTKEVGKGTGLGLSMVYGIIRKHGGYIDLASEPGAGATFMIYLPVHDSA